MDTELITRNQNKLTSLPPEPDSPHPDDTITTLETADDRVNNLEIEQLDIFSTNHCHINIYIDKEHATDVDVSAGDNPNHDPPLTRLKDVLGVEGVHSELVHLLAPIFDTTEQAIALDLLENTHVSFSGYGDDNIDFLMFTYAFDMPRQTPTPA